MEIAFKIDIFSPEDGTLVPKHVGNVTLILY
jgi:hypothetical protein